MATSIIKRNGFSVVMKQTSLTYSNYFANGSIDVAATGKKPLAVVGWSIEGSSAGQAYIPKIFISETTLNYGVRMNATSGSYSHTLKVWVLYADD